MSMRVVLSYVKHTSRYAVCSRLLAAGDARARTRLGPIRGRGLRVRARSGPLLAVASSRAEPSRAEPSRAEPSRPFSLVWTQRR